MVGQMDFGFSVVPAPGVSWERFPAICRADYAMLLDGRPTGFWVRACGHPTALRPYYVVSPTGEELERKFAHLVDAKAAAIAWHKEECVSR